jgi:aminopeptidase N
MRRLSTRNLVLGVAAAFAAGAVVALAVAGVNRWQAREETLVSGGVLSPGEAAYDVRRYDLAVRLEPATRSLAARSVVTVATLAPLAELELDLDHRLKVARTDVDGATARFERRGDKLFVRPAAGWSAGERHAVGVDYSGKPKVSKNPPWNDGFVWSETADGKPWIGVVSEVDGADIWRPIKDHPSDEPDEGASVELTAPAGTVGLASGRRVWERTNADGTSTSRWEVSYPINNYLLTVNVGPYVEVVERYRGADGRLDVPATFWVLPQDVAAARAAWREAPLALAVFARRFGEFPFLADKIGAVEAPFDGMEHQTLVALGDNFLVDRSGIHEVQAHELAHEWWGNKISARDWDHMWIQEGFATYAEVLFVADRFGEAAARRYLERLRREITNEAPLVASRPRTAAEVYGGDIYDKGAWVLATLRWQIGDDAFFRALRRFADDPPGACRLVDSADFERVVAEESGERLDWFWRRYLRTAAPPRYELRRGERGGEGTVKLRWDEAGFELPLPLRVDGELRRVPMPGGAATIEVRPGARVVVELAGRVLAEPIEAAGLSR